MVCKKSVIGFLLLPFLVSASYADSKIKDPMQPPGKDYVAIGNAPKTDQGWYVSEILISPQRRLAVVNGRVVKVGSLINGARISAIYGNAVELNVNGKKVLTSPVMRDVKRTSKQ